MRQRITRLLVGGALATLLLGASGCIVVDGGCWPRAYVVAPFFDHCFHHAARWCH
ncbi:MAG: hypothetical protein ACKVX7_07430 [Planctomycetota bacterium]